SGMFETSQFINILLLKEKIKNKVF
ncbi:MAG: hypothetical protein RJA13_1135, partial [Bacteroidota bacterium]